jgi:uncharacterized repeat protein (TIGR02543 family)
VTGAQTYASLAVTEKSSITLIAKWLEPAAYTVNYNTDGGTTVDSKTAVKWTDSGLLPATNPTRPGYTFEKWYLSTDTDETAVTGAATYGSLAVTEKPSVTLKAKWQEPSVYTVNYDTDGGTTISPKTSVKWTDSGLLPATNPTKPGYTFVKWYLSTDGSEASVTGAQTYGSLAVTEQPSVTLIAKWQEPPAYTVNYNTDGGTTVPSKTSVKWTDAGLLPGSNPTRPGYTFVKWYLSTDGSETQVTGAATYGSLAVTEKPSVTLKAKWSENGSYIVNYDTDGGTPVTSKTLVKWTDAGLLPGSNPTKPGYTFEKWYLSTDGGEAQVTGAQTYGSLAVTEKISITLKAKWQEPAAYTVNYNTDGGTTVSPKTSVKWTGSGLLPGTNPTKPGYTFVKWYLSTDLLETAVTGAATYASLAVTEKPSVTLKAKWQENTAYIVKYNPDGGTAISDKTGVKWTDSGLLPANPTRVGYNFVKWYLSTDSLETAVGAGTTYGSLAVTEKSFITLKAKWSAKTGIQVSFDAQGGTAPVPAGPMSVTYDAFYGPLPTTARAGYSFSGWWTHPSAGVLVNSTTSRVANENSHTLYARWTPLPQTVRYHANYPGAAAAPYVDGGSPAYTTGSAAAVKTYPATGLAGRTGYTFVGWATSAVGPAAYPAASLPDSLPAMPAGGQDLYAQWVATTDNILVLNANGGTGGALLGWTDLEYDKTIVAQIPARHLPVFGEADAPTRDNYKIIGWGTAPGTPNVADFTDGSLVNWVGTKTVHAVWQGDPVNVSFYNNYTPTDLTQYAAGNSANVGKRFGDTLSPFTPPRRAGYTFRGWYSAPSAGTQWDFASDVISTPTQLDLYALWTENDTYTVVYDMNKATSPAVPSKTRVKWTQTDLVPAAPTRVGYDFLGWDVSAGGAGHDVQGTASYGSLAANDAVMAVTLRAQWKAQPVDVRFDPNGGQAVPSTVGSKGAVYDSPVGTLPTSGSGSPAWDDESHVFVGWSKTPGATVPDFTSAYVVDFVPEMTVYAVWRDMGGGGGGGSTAGGAATGGAPGGGSPPSGGGAAPASGSPAGTAAAPAASAAAPAAAAPNAASAAPNAPGAEAPASPPKTAASPEGQPPAPGTDAEASIANSSDPNASPDGLEGGTWALLNLVLTVVAAAVAVLLLVAGRKRRQRRDGRSANGLRTASVGVVVVAAVLLLLTQDMSQSMVAVDGWTAWHVVLVAAEAVLAVLTMRLDRGRERI